MLGHRLRRWSNIGQRRIQFSYFSVFLTFSFSDYDGGLCRLAGTDPRRLHNKGRHAILWCAL